MILSTDHADLISPEGIAAGVEVLLRGAQRSASIAQEAGASEQALVITHPWLFGPKSIRPLLIDVAMGERTITVTDYLNLLTIAFRLEPSISVCAVTQGDLPEPAEVIAAMAAR